MPRLELRLAVGDVRQVTIDGLRGCEYIDKTRGGERRREADEPIRIVEETDRVYLNIRAPCTVNDPVLARRIRIEKSGSGSTVVWNPWIEKAKAMTDFGDDEWTKMVCVETSNVGPHAVTLAAGQPHTMIAKLGVCRLT